MTVYTYSVVPVWDNLGGNVRLARGQTITVMDPTTGLTAPGLEQNGSPVAVVTADNGGVALFTSTLGTVDIRASRGPVQRVTSPDALAGGGGGGGIVADATSGVKGVVKLAGDLAGTAAAPTVPGLVGKASKANLSVNVKDYGAVGNGSTDDRAAIQSALDAAGAGGNIYFPPGTYRLATLSIAASRVLKTYPGQTLYGSGRYVSMLKVGASLGDYVTVIGCATDGTDAGSWAMTGMGIDQTSATNALVIASMGTYPKMGVRLGSYTAGSSVTIRDCAFTDGDNVNTAYVFADTLDVSGNHFVRQGGPVGTLHHDHSTLYTTTTTLGGTQSITGNTFRGVTGSGGATTAIETHGGTQTVTGNTISGYIAGANLTGVATPNPTDGIVFTGNTIKGVCIGVDVWSYYTGALTSGTALRNVIISSNSISIDRDPWASVYTAECCGIMANPNNTAPIEGLTITSNTITYLPIDAAGRANDSKCVGISLPISAVAAKIYDLAITGNAIVRPVSAGVWIAAALRRAKISDNTVVDPAQSTHASVNTVYRSGMVVSGTTLEDVGFERNALVDTRDTHYADNNIICVSPLLSAVQCWARNNTTRFADGVTPRCSFMAANVAGTAFHLEESSPVGTLPWYATTAGSKITRTSNGVVVTQVQQPSGTVWVTDSGNGSPEGVVTALRGAVYRRLDGGAGTTLYVKETGTGNTGWAAK